MRNVKAKTWNYLEEIKKVIGRETVNTVREIAEWQAKAPTRLGNSR